MEFLKIRNKKTLNIAIVYAKDFYEGITMPQYIFPDHYVVFTYTLDDIQKMTNKHIYGIVTTYTEALYIFRIHGKTPIECIFTTEKLIK